MSYDDAAEKSEEYRLRVKAGETAARLGLTSMAAVEKELLKLFDERDRKLKVEAAALDRKSKTAARRSKDEDDLREDLRELGPCHTVPTVIVGSRYPDCRRCKRILRVLLTDQQSGLCRMCKQPLAGNRSLDHCHRTMRIRGVLCNSCNMGLGLLKDDPVRITEAVRYLAFGLDL